MVFVDRTHVYRQLPEFLIGAEYVMLANNDKTNADYQLDITCSSDATLYLFIDNRVGDNAVDNPPTLGPVMQWVLDMGFQSTFTQIGVDEKGQGTPNGWNTVYCLNVPAGTITLYAQADGSSRRMYGVAAVGVKRTADAPQPHDNATDVPCEITLTWRPGQGAVSHDVYLGSSLEELTNASRTNPLGILVSQAQDPNFFKPTSRLAFGQLYFWRVDEAAGDGSIIKGEIWQFQTEPIAYPVPSGSISATASSYQPGYGPENTINGSGLDANDCHCATARDMWQTAPSAQKPIWIQYQFDKIYKLHQLVAWNYNGDLEFLVGIGLKDVTIDYSLDGLNWSRIGDFVFKQGISKAGYRANTIIDLAGICARYVRLTVNSSYGSTGIYGLSEVRFLYIPTYPRSPQPQDQIRNVGINPVLSWRPGREAAYHRLVLGTSQQAVDEDSVKGITLASPSYLPSTLLLDQTYYWKVIEINDNQPITSWQGPVWGFTTTQFLELDGFESYTDNKDAGQAIWQTWVDGYGTTTNGSQLGHLTMPYAERTIVRTGWQSMPLYFDNTSGAAYSEATRSFDPPQDWTRAGIRYLTIYFQGLQINTSGRLYIKINDALVPYDGHPSDLTRPVWILWPIDLAKVNADLSTVRTMAIGIDNGGHGTLCIDDIRLYRTLPQQATAGVWVEAEDATTITYPMQVFSDRSDASAGRYIAAFGDNSTTNPPSNGRASYTVRLDPGTYRILGRVIAPTGNDDSFWVLLEGATTNTTNHISGWVRWSLDLDDNWHEVPVSSMDDNDQIVLFTVEGGVYNLLIAFREDGALLDAFMIIKEK